MALFVTLRYFVFPRLPHVVFLVVISVVVVTAEAASFEWGSVREGLREVEAAV